MTDTITTLRPASTGTFTGFTVVPSGTAEAVLSDDSDSTYILAGGGGSLGIFPVTPFTLPALAILHSVTARIRASDAAIDALPFGFFESDGFAHIESMNAIVAISNATALSQRTDHLGNFWTEAKVNALTLTCGAPNFSAAHIFELYLDVAFNQAPTVTGFGINSSGSSQPLFTLPYSDPEGDIKERHQIAVYTSVQSDPFGDVDPTVPLRAVWYSGEVYTADTTQVCGARLKNSTTYYAYARAADVGSGGRYGPIATVSWTTMFEVIGVPVLSVPLGDAPTTSVENLSVQSRLNLLSRDTADLEGGVGDWAVAAFCTIASSTDQAFRLTHSLKVIAVTPAGDVTITTGRKSAVPGELYTAMICVRAATAREVTLNLVFADGTPTEIGRVVSDGWEVAGAWVRLFVTGRCPAGATQQHIGVHWIGAVDTEVHYLDAAVITPGTVNVVDNAEFDERDHMWALLTSGTGIAAIKTDDRWPQDGAGADGACVRLVKNDTNASALGPASTSGSVHWFGVQTGEQYIVSAWLKRVSRDFGAYDAMIEFVYQDGLNTAQKAITDLPPGVWVQRFLALTVPASKTAGRVRISAGDRYDTGAWAEVLVDAVQVQRVGAGLVNGDFETALSASREDGFDGRGWTPVTLAADVTRDTGTVHGGTHSLRLSRPAGDAVSGSPIQASQDVYVAGATSITVDYWWRLNNVSAAHGSDVRLRFYDVARQLIQLTVPYPGLTGLTNDGSGVYLSPNTGSVGDTGWLHRGAQTVPIPARAVWAELLLEGGWSGDGTNPGDTRIDDVTVSVTGTVGPAPFTPGGWSVGGYAAAGHVVLLERSNDGGLSWYPVRFSDVIYPDGYPVTASPWRASVPTDYEARNGSTVLYRTTSFVPFADGSLTPSSSWITSVVTPAVRRLWIKDPRDHTRNHPFYTRRPGVVFDSQERQVVKQTLGSTDVVVIADTIQRESIGVPIVCMDGNDLAALYLLRSGQRTLLVQNHLGYQWYVRLGASAPVTILDEAPVTDVPVTGVPQLPPST